MQKLVFDHKPTSLQPKSDESRKRRLRGPMLVGLIVLIGLVLFLLPIVSSFRSGRPPSSDWEPTQPRSC